MPSLKHGRSYTKKHARWRSLKCRGVLCDEWLDPVVFLDWLDINEVKGLALTRVDKTKPLGPDNYRFTNRSENTKVHIDNALPVILEKGDEELEFPSCAEAAVFLGVSRQFIHQVLNSATLKARGWDVRRKGDKEGCSTG